MMKETNFGPLLLLLLLAVTPRNSCANPTASPDGIMDGVPAHLSSPRVNGTTEGVPATMIIAEGMKEGADNGTTEGVPATMTSIIANDIKEGADILTAAMTWLKDNTQSSQFDESIRDLTNQIHDLHIELGEHFFDILVALYKSQDRLEQLKTVLEEAATNLMRSCNYLVHIYDGNECSEGLLKFTAEEFVENANFVNDLLKRASIITIDIQDLLSAAKAFIIDSNTKQDYEIEEIKAEQEAAVNDIQVLKSKLDNQKQKLEIMLNEDEQYTDKVTILSCIFLIGFDCTIRSNPFMNRNMRAAAHEAFTDRRELERKLDIQEKRQNNIDKQSEQLNKTKPFLKSTTTLLSHVQDVKVYLEMEINLITEWQLSLEASIWYNEDIKPEDIKYNIKGIKERLIVLKKACEDYLAHELPDIL